MKKSIPTVAVLLSTYNGEKYIKEQIESILNQKNVEILLYIRDDGSKDNTIDIINQYCLKYNGKIIVEMGKNVGWKKSFNEILYNAPEADYYAFSDQDDVWMPNKLENAVEKLVVEDKPALYYSDVMIVDENLNYIGIKKNTAPVETCESYLSQAYGQGCTMVFNKKARELYKSYRLKKAVSHEAWMSILCAYFGSIIYEPETYLYYRQHENNTIGVRNNISTINKMISFLVNYLEKFKSGGFFCDYSKELLDGYATRMNEMQREIVECYARSEKSMIARIRIIGNKNIRYYNPMGTVLLKSYILLKGNKGML